MSCKGICERFKAKDENKALKYANGYKRCQECCIFITNVWTLTRCPCCNTKLRTRPRKRENKEAFVTAMTA